MAAQKPATSWIPGASDYLGYGVNIFGKCYRPDLKDKFLDFTPYDLDPKQIGEQKIPGTDTPFRLPTAIEYTNIPSATGTKIVVDTKQKVSEELSSNANAKGTYGAFSATVKASYKNFNEMEEERWYCITDGSQLVYSLHAPNLDTRFLHAQVKNKDVYANLLRLLTDNKPISPATEEVYFSFFNWYGTHVIRGVEMGGGLHMYTSLLKTYLSNENEVKTSATTEYTGVFEGGGGADWRKKIENWLTHRQGSIEVYGGDPGSPLLATVMSGTIPTTDLSKELKEWAAGVKTNPTMVNLKLVKIGDLFQSQEHQRLVNTAYERYAQSFLSLTIIGQQSLLEWQRKPVTLPVTPKHALNGQPVAPGPKKFQGWVVFNRTTGAVESVIPFAELTPQQVVPADLTEGGKYSNENYLVLFAHWEATYDVLKHWTETPFNSEMVTFLRRCGAGKTLQDYNNASRPQGVRPDGNVDSYFQGFYVLCGVVGSGSGQGLEFTNIYNPLQYNFSDRNTITIPLVPQATSAGFRLSLLD